MKALRNRSASLPGGAQLESILKNQSSKLKGIMLLVSNAPGSIDDVNDDPASADASDEPGCGGGPASPAATLHSDTSPTTSRRAPHSSVLLSIVVDHFFRSMPSSWINRERNQPAFGRLSAILLVQIIVRCSLICASRAAVAFLAYFQSSAW
jgi:hypothetical protein